MRFAIKRGKNCALDPPAIGSGSLSGSARTEVWPAGGLAGTSGAGVDTLWPDLAVSRTRNVYVVNLRQAQELRDRRSNALFSLSTTRIRRFG
jgi:hypothetical protein